MDFRDLQAALFVWDIPTFSQAVIREVILNAVCHRDYWLGGSVFVRQFPKRIEIVSPGGVSSLRICRRVGNLAKE